MPNQNPFAMLIRSRKFLLAMTDAIVSTVLMLATRYLSPADLDFVKQIVLIYQPVVIILIGSIAYEDKARLENPPLTTTTQTVTATSPTTNTLTTIEAKPEAPPTPPIDTSSPRTALPTRSNDDTQVYLNR